MRRRKLTTEQYVNEIKSGNRFILSQAITLAESQLSQDQSIAKEVIDSLLPTSGESVRIGITGVPGVGKSTFIDQFGMHLINDGHKVAVLSVDPSSQQSKGSILGDKTRMKQLSLHPDVYIRPTAAGSHLGGVAQQTREAILLCEAAGYDIIIVETVGVGQSETTVRHLTDFFLLLMLGGAGDELQGMKRGIMEMADAIAINKADGNNLDQAGRAKRNYEQALHLFSATDSKLSPKVFTCSALENHGLVEIWLFIKRSISYGKETQYFQLNRQQQQQYWLNELITQKLTHDFFGQEKVKQILPQIQKDVTGSKITPREGAERLLKAYRD